MMKGQLITFEGPEGAGKTTVMQRVANALCQEARYEVVVTREPGGSAIAERIRTILLDVNATEMDMRTEALLFAAARRQHLVEVIVPALKRGAIVLCDRFVDSSLAYQGIVRGIGYEEIWKLNTFAIDGYLPQCTLLIDVPAEVGLERIKQGRTFDETNRLDRETIEFHQQVRQAFLQLANNEERFVVIDGTQSIEQVTNMCLEAIKRLTKG